jgi:hypothetical protein
LTVLKLFVYQIHYYLAEQARGGDRCPESMKLPAAEIDAQKRLKNGDGMA